MENIVYRSYRNIDRIKSSGLPSEQRSHPRPPIPTRSPYSLPEPFPITHHMSRLGWGAVAAKKLSDAYMISATRMKAIYEQNLNNAINACVQADPTTDVAAQVSSLKAKFLSTYQKGLAELMVLTEQRVRVHPPSPSVSALEDAFTKRSLFRQVCTCTEH